ncbi:hypothetical protein [Kitasatospora sp. NPDC094015]|uniref:hypothetical protein n=1 Tax=Kitasatospora sp. NPDC094015 TaxID=3155205 RepID=UPI0033195B23
MLASPRSVFRWGSVLAGVTALGVFALGATGPSPRHAAPAPAAADMAGMAGMDHGAAPTPAAAAAGTGTGAPAMSGMAAGEGLLPELDGYRMDSTVTSLPGGRAVSYPFTITGPDGRPLTDFAVAQTKKLHFYAIRSDLTGYQHLHPEMAADGGWTADLAALAPGDWRLYAAFTPGSGPDQGIEFALSRTVAVTGDAAPPQPLPAATGSTTVDGYTVAVQGEPAAAMTQQFTVTISKDGRPVTDLQPYLDSYAHLSAFREGTEALAHLHPGNPVDGDHGGPTLTFTAMIGEPGNWRVFLQFRTAGELHTAVLTLHVS